MSRYGNVCERGDESWKAKRAGFGFWIINGLKNAHTLLQRPDTASAQPPYFLLYSVFSLPSCLRIFTSDLDSVACPSQLPKEEILPYLPLSKSSSNSFGNLPLLIYLFSKVNHSMLSPPSSLYFSSKSAPIQSSSQLHSFTSRSTSCITSYSISRLHLVLHDWCWSTTWSSWRHLGAFGAQKKCLKRSTDEQRTRATSPERRREVAVTHIPERPGQSDMERSLAFLS
ncbi:hypothetical protein F2Q70_00018693 [Brassica cretica]|uniref:Uncharacterized protein n=1 Tax=Brassica cretica TaxID=69181 RepID=A0A8S9HVQ4_BRACR|nr:hypothetical protein F2Q70_00018693 [Brassica cretica]